MYQYVVLGVLSQGGREGEYRNFDSIVPPGTPGDMCIYIVKAFPPGTPGDMCKL